MELQKGLGAERRQRMIQVDDPVLLTLGMHRSWWIKNTLGDVFLFILGFLSGRMFSLEVSGKPLCLAAGHQVQPCETMALLSPTLSAKTRPKTPPNLPSKPCLLLRAAAEQHNSPLSNTWILLQARPSLRSGQAQHTPCRNGVKAHSLHPKTLPLCNATSI